MDFSSRGPQHVVHRSGYRVFVKSRDRVGYQDSDVAAEAEVEFASAKFAGLVTLYRESLMVTSGDAAGSEVDIIQRVTEGLRAMGATVEIA